MLGKHRYLVSDSITIADIAIVGFMLALPYNETKEHCHILQACID
jgi:glutathione S-transferase